MLKNVFKTLAICTAGILPLTGNAATISANGLSVTTGTNGGISYFNYTEEFFRLGAYVSDFGFQLGTSTGTFALGDSSSNSASGYTVSSIVDSATDIVVTGLYQGFSFVRTYTIDSSSPVLAITTMLTNLSSASTTIRAFEVADPDQGPGSATANDVLTTAAGHTVVQSTNGTSVVLGTDAANTVTGTLPSLGIYSGTSLNNFFMLPGDPNGATSDIGIAVGAEFTLEIGETGSFTTYYAAGNDAATALANYDAAASLPAVPVPAGLPLLAGGLALFGALRRKQKN